MSECLGLFAKYWQPGKVKTRLAASLGEEEAANAYQQFVVTLLRRFADYGNERWLAFDPPEHAQEFDSLAAEKWQIEPQISGDLCERMQAFFQNRLAAGAQRVVLLGTDSPNVPQQYIQQAFEALNQSDVVLGPTEDGGYWLVGLSSSAFEIFDEMPWSTPQLWEATLQKLDESQRVYTTVPTWYDVDNLSDLQRLIADLQSDCYDEPALSDLLEHLQ